MKKSVKPGRVAAASSGGFPRGGDADSDYEVARRTWLRAQQARELGRRSRRRPVTLADTTGGRDA